MILYVYVYIYLYMCVYYVYYIYIMYVHIINHNYKLTRDGKKGHAKHVIEFTGPSGTPGTQHHRTSPCWITISERRSRRLYLCPSSTPSAHQETSHGHWGARLADGKLEVFKFRSHVKAVEIYRKASSSVCCRLSSHKRVKVFHWQ